MSTEGRPPPLVVLIQPPQWTPQNPPFGLASLGGHLRSRGIPTRLVDLNLRCYLEILTSEYMRYARQVALMRREHLQQRVRMRLLQGDEAQPLSRDAEHLQRLDEAFAQRPDPWSEAAARLPWALETLRGDRFYDPEALLEALACVDAALELAALPCHPTRLALNDHRNPAFDLTLSELERGTRDSWSNLFHPMLRAAVPDLLEGAPRMLALSINSFSQVLPGLTLARLLRETAPPGCHLTIGGNFFGRVAHRLQNLPEFFRLYCDSVVVGEGEEALERLCSAVLAGTALDEPSEVLHLTEHGHVHRTARVPGQRMPLRDVGFVDLADLPLDGYLTPAPVVCIQGSRGCYWGKCTFCDAYWGSSLDTKPPPRVLAEIRHLRERYGIRNFEFIDECMPPQTMRELSAALAAACPDVRWFANARTEPGFAEAAPELRSGGATMLLWGFESGSERILKRAGKGVDPARRWDVLRAAAAADLWNFAYIFFGFPGETTEEAMATIRAICEHTDVIHSYGRSLFTMGLHSPMARRPRQFGVVEVADEGEDLSVNLRYRASCGPTADEMEERARLCARMCREAYRNPLWMVLRNRENLHLYLARYGTDRVAGWHLDPALADAETTAFQK